jgi:hypothetical protein
LNTLQLRSSYEVCKRRPEVTWLPASILLDILVVESSSSCVVCRPFSWVTNADATTFLWKEAAAVGVKQTRLRTITDIVNVPNPCFPTLVVEHVNIPFLWWGRTRNSNATLVFLLSSAFGKGRP